MVIKKQVTSTTRGINFIERSSRNIEIEIQIGPSGGFAAQTIIERRARPLVGVGSGVPISFPLRPSAEPSVTSAVNPKFQQLTAEKNQRSSQRTRRTTSFRALPRGGVRRAIPTTSTTVIASTLF